MSDLISRSELLKKLKSINSVLFLMMQSENLSETQLLKLYRNSQPPIPLTKVVAELEKELSLADKEKERCTGENNLQFDSAKGYASGISTAIEIVKQGGVSDDVCEKMQMQAYNKAVDNCLKILYFHQNEYDGIQWAIREIEELKEMESD